MKRLHIKTQFGYCILHFALCIFLVLLSACGSNTETSVNTSSDTGSITFSIVWESGPKISSSQKAAIRQDVCVDYSIDTINATVYNSSNTIVATASWPCSAHSGTISDVPTGSGMRLVLEGIVSGTAEWQGEITGITVSANQTTSAGTVTMSYIGDTLIWDESNWDEKNWG